MQSCEPTPLQGDSVPSEGGAVLAINPWQLLEGVIMFTFHWHLPGARLKVQTCEEIQKSWSPCSVEAALLNIAALWKEGRATEFKGGLLDENHQWACDSNGPIIRNWRQFAPNQMGTVYLHDGTVVEVWDGNISG